MGLKNKSLPTLLLSLMLMAGCGLASNNVGVEEGSFDKFNNSPKYQLRAMTHVGQDDVVSYSDIYAQYGSDDSNNYWIRFATAVKGDISKLTYVRDAVEERGETESVEYEVATVYKAVTSEGKNTYYNAETGLSTNEEDAGNYYWACYSIKIANVKYYSTTISMSFKIDDEVVKTRKVSLNSLLGNEKAYRFEAENAKIDGNSGNPTAGDQGHACFAKSTYVSPKFSGGICLRNNYYFTSTYDFASNVKDDFAKLKLFMNTTGATKLSRLLSIVVNGETLDLSNIEVPANGESYVPNNTYFKMCEVVVPVSLISGENSIVISHGTSSSTANMDYIEVITSADVSNFVETPFIDSDVELTIEKMPTNVTEGIIKATCTHEELGKEHGSASYNIPTLADTSFYKSTRDEENSTTNVEFVISNKTFEFSYKDSYTLKLRGATFEDGTSTKLFTIDEIASGAAQTLVPNVPEGQEFVGLYDCVTKEYEATSNPTYTMGFADAEIEAVYKPKQYVQSGSGYLDFADGYKSSSGFADGLVSGTTVRISFKHGNKTEDRITSYAGNGTYGTIFEFDVLVNSGSFRAKTYYDVNPGSYEQTYNVYNFSSESVTLTLIQNNGSAETNPNAKPSKTVTIGSNSYATIVLEYTFNVENTHSLTYFKFAKAMNNVKLGVTSSIKVK